MGYTSHRQSQWVRRLPFLDDFSRQHRKTIDIALNQQQQRQRETRQSWAERVDHASKDIQREFRDLLGRDKLRELQNAIRHERLSFRERLQPPAGLNRDYAKEQKASNQRIDAFVKKLGGNPKKLRAIAIEHGQRLLRTFSVADERLMPLHWQQPGQSLYPPGDASDPHQWFRFEPPFFGFLFSFWDSWSDNFRVDRKLSLDPATGLVGNEITLDCKDGDGDAAMAGADTQVAFPFVPPTAGILHVIVDAQFLNGMHDLEVRDDFGFSYSTGYQLNYLILSILQSTEPDTMAFSEEPLFRWDTDSDVSVQRQNLIYLQHYVADFYSSTPVRGGQPLIVTVGTEDRDYGSAQDMDLHSNSNFQWRISSIQVRIEP